MAQPRLFGALLTLTALIFDCWDEIPADDSGHRHVSFNRVYGGVMHVLGKTGTLADLTRKSKEQKLLDSANGYPMLLELQQYLGTYHGPEISGTAKTILDELIRVRINRIGNHVDQRTWTFQSFAPQLSMSDLTTAMGMDITISCAGNKKARQYVITKNEHMPSEYEWLESLSMGLGFGDDTDTDRRGESDDTPEWMRKAMDSI